MKDICVYISASVTVGVIHGAIEFYRSKQVELLLILQGLGHIKYS